MSTLVLAIGLIIFIVLWVRARREAITLENRLAKERLANGKTWNWRNDE